MGKWEEVEVGSCLIEMQTGKTPPKNQIKYYENPTIDWFSPSDFDDDIKDLSNSKYKISSNAINEGKAKIYPLDSLLLIGIGATVGKVGILKYPASSNQQITALTFKDNLNIDFAYYWFRNIKDYIINMASSATMPIINQKEIKRLPIRFPKSLPEQQRIVAKLDGLFAKIDQAIGLLEENVTHTQALMGSVLDEEFGCSKHKSKPIKELVLRTKTLNPKTEYSQEEFTYIDISSINKDIFQIENPKILLGNDAPSRARKVVEKGDIVFATTRPNLKNIAIVSEDYDNPIASTGFCLLRTKKDLINNEYLFYFLISEKVQDYIQPFIRGAQYPAISDKDLLSIEIPFLPIEDQKNTVIRIKSVFDVSSSFIETQTQKLNHLKSLKSSLLDQAFKGEL